MNKKEYNIIVDRYADGVYRFVLANIKNEFLAQDIVQDSFEKLWINHENVEFNKAKSFLFKIAYNKMIDSIRHNKIINDHSKEINIQNYDFDITNERMELQEILHKALLKLNDVQKSVVLLRDYEGYSYEEIAQITGLSESQVKVYIFRARQNLKNYLVSFKEFII